MKDKFELSLLESGELVRKSTMMILNNVGRIVALITLVISAMVLFTDIKLADFGKESFSSTLAVMLLSSYLMYFSMSETGENTAKQCEEYKNAEAKYCELVKLIGGEKITALRQFCRNYAADELKYRRESFLMKYGYGTEEYEEFKKGKKYGKKAHAIFRRAEKFHAVSLTPKVLLSTELSKDRSELSNPEKFRFVSMFFKLLPTTLCMTVTVSVMLTTKENMTTAVVLDGVFKLLSLLLIGFKGFVSGYNYKRHKYTLWLETKTRLLDAFLKAS